MPYLTVDDLDNATFDLFRRYAKLSRRMEEADLQDDNKGLLEKLRLYEGSYLKRAATLLFHPDPEKYVTGAFVKIGFFREDADLVYQVRENMRLSFLVLTFIVEHLSALVRQAITDVDLILERLVLLVFQKV